MNPDLSDSVARRAYRQELRSAYRGRRLLAVALLAGGGIVLAVSRLSGFKWRFAEPLAWTAIGAGAAACIVVVALRSRYHRQRMAE